MAQITTDTLFGVQQRAALDAARIEPLDLKDMFRTLWMGKWLIMFTTALAVVSAGYYAFAVAQPRFAATTTLHIAPSQNGASDSAGRVATLNTEVAILTSHHLLGQVARQLELGNDPAFNRYLMPVPRWSVTQARTRLRNALTGQVEVIPNTVAIAAKTVENLKGAISVLAHRESHIVDITATTGSAADSARIVNALAALYLADQDKARFSATETAVNWLSEQVYALQLELARKEAAITDVITVSQVSDQTALEVISRQITETNQRLRAARDALAASTVVGQDPAIITTAARASGNQSRRLTGQIDTLEAFHASLVTQLADQSAGMVQLQQLQRETDATRVLYETFLARLQEVSLERGLQSPESRVLNVAVNGHYVAPRKMLILAIAALLGVTIGIAWTFVHDALRAGFRDAATLGDAANLPVMAQVPLMRLRKSQVLLDHLATRHAAPAIDAIRSLRTSLLLAETDDPPQTILCTSSVAGEGKTVMAITLAQNLAALGKSVLLLDGDPRGGGVARHLGISPAHALSAVLNGNVTLDMTITSDPRWNVDVITGHIGADNPADLFCGAAFTTFMNRLRERYDYIVVDAPPVLPVPDARLLAQHADAVIYAVRWNKTPVDFILAGKRELDNVRAPITGLVLSQVDLRKARHYGRASSQTYGRSYG